MAYNLCTDDTVDLDCCPNLVRLTAVDYDHPDPEAIGNFFSKIKTRRNLRELKLDIVYDDEVHGFDLISSAIQSNIKGTLVVCS